MRSQWIAITSLLALLASAWIEPTPATQVMVVLNSDLQIETELKRVRIDVMNADEPTRPIASDEFALRAGETEGTHRLPLSFSLIPSAKDPAVRFLVVARGYGSNDVNAAAIVEQKVIAAFESEQTLLLEMFLGRVCLQKLCDEQTTCYVRAEQGFTAGQCGAIPVRTLPQVEPSKAIEESDWSPFFSGDGDGDSAPDHLGDGSAGDSKDGGLDGDANHLGDGGGDPTTFNDAGLPVACAAPNLEAARCDLPETYEPNNGTSTALPLPITAGCGGLTSTLRSNDLDYFYFSTTLDEPVRVTLDYTAAGTEDLKLWVDPGQGPIGSGRVHSRPRPSPFAPTPGSATRPTSTRVLPLSVSPIACSSTPSSAPTSTKTMTTPKRRRPWRLVRTARSPSPPPST